MQVRLIRHATLVVTIGGRRLLVDPMLSPKEAMEPVRNAPNERRIPMVDLPFSQEELGRLLGQIDAVLVTHTHRDHWDARAAEVIPRHLPIICQPPDEGVFRGAGFGQVIPVETSVEWQGIQINRTGGEHGLGEIGQQMAPVSGFVLRAEGETPLYIAGDTIWCPAVQDALTAYEPGVVVVNAGAAAFLTGGPITMTAENVYQVSRAEPLATVIAVHMEAVNHCLLTRADLRKGLAQHKLSERVRVPDDGEVLEF